VYPALHLARVHAHDVGRGAESSSSIVASTAAVTLTLAGGLILRPLAVRLEDNCQPIRFIEIIGEFVTDPLLERRVVERIEKCVTGGDISVN
jgi:hypothetical protein